MLFAGAFKRYASGMPQPVKLSQADIAGKLFEDHHPVETVDGSNVTRDVEVFISPERDFDAGIWNSNAATIEFSEPYPYNEYMHFLKDSVTLISTDGTVTKLEAGDSVVLPRGWTGTWKTPGCTKIYVIHAPGKPL